MKHTFRAFSILAILALLFATFGYMAQPAKADPAYVCLPTCEENDARFFTVAGTGLQTLADETIRLQLAAPGDAATIEIGIFDGDTSGMWDTGTTALQYNLYADPLAIGDETILVAQWSGSDMYDNDWYTVTLPNAPEAKAPSGNYFYHLYAHTTAPGTTYFSNFKARTDGYLFTVRPSVFAFMAALNTMEDAYVIYPNLPELTTTTYDGSFSFYVHVPSSVSYFTESDGDLDYGSWNQATKDTDDLDTPNDVFPDWAVGTSAVFEGIAVGLNGASGDPADDSPALLYKRSPSVFYTVTDPNGNVYQNDNPSGNMEWEQFRLETDPAVPADYYVTELLPSGLYHIQLQGMDLHNLNAWRFSHSMLGVCPAPPEGTPDPCKEPLHPYTIGDTLYNDANGNGLQDEGEAGIPGVLVNLLDSNGQTVRDINGSPITTVTGADGAYSFEVEGQFIDSQTGQMIADGVYIVQVDQANFAAGGPLAGLTSTTGGEQQTNTVVDANVLTYDFGYNLPCTPNNDNLANGAAIVALNPAACQGQQNGLMFHGTASTYITGDAFSNGCLRSVGTHSVEVTDGLVQYVGPSFGNLSLINPLPVQVPETLPESAWKVNPPNCSDPAAHNVKAKDFKGDVNLEPGLYCITGDLKINANQHFTGSGVTLYLVNGGLHINGKATVQLTAPPLDVAAVYPALPNILFYVNGVNGRPQVQINGNSDSFFDGVVYAPGSEVEVLGTGLVNGIHHLQIIGWDVRIGGTADVYVNYQGSGLPVCTP